MNNEQIIPTRTTYVEEAFCSRRNRKSQGEDEIYSELRIYGGVGMSEDVTALISTVQKDPKEFMKTSILMPLLKEVVD